MNIFLIGYMGSGKTTIGKLLAKKLEMDFIDMDDYLVNQQGRTINDIFEKDGEAAFRDIEKQVLHELFTLDNKVIATGGGAPCFFDNIEQMNKHGKCFYLKMPTDGLVNRLMNATAERPLIKGKSKEELESFIAEALQKREPFYCKAQYKIEALNMRVDDFMPYFDGQY